MKVESATWNPPKTGGRCLSESVKALYEMKPGDCIRIHHPELKCNMDQCSLKSAMSRKGKGVFRSYHERPNVAVVQRIA